MYGAKTLEGQPALNAVMTEPSRIIEVRRFMVKVWYVKA